MECAPTRHLQCSLRRGLPPPPGDLAGSVGETILFLLAPGSIDALYVIFVIMHQTHLTCTSAHSLQ